MPFFKVSAATGENIEAMFYAVIDLIGDLISKTARLEEIKETQDTLPTSVPVKIEEVVENHP